MRIGLNDFKWGESPYWNFRVRILNVQYQQLRKEYTYDNINVIIFIKPQILISTYPMLCLEIEHYQLQGVSSITATETLSLPAREHIFCSEFNTQHCNPQRFQQFAVPEYMDYEKVHVQAPHITVLKIISK